VEARGQEHQCFETRTVNRQQTKKKPIEKQALFTSKSIAGRVDRPVYISRAKAASLPTE
jgi:hypothetical protein